MAGISNKQAVNGLAKMRRDLENSDPDISIVEMRISPAYLLFDIGKALGLNDKDIQAILGPVGTAVLQNEGCFSSFSEWVLEIA